MMQVLSFPIYKTDVNCQTCLNEQMHLMLLVYMKACLKTALYQ